MHLFLAAAAALLCVVTADKFEPAVAFVCERGAMHMHKDGKWISDPATDCMESKAEMLAYCKKMYPALDVTNIVESSEYKHIKGWCPLGKTSCSNTEAFKVRPYRCLTGPFQSDALIVPKQCVFDHVHQPKQCHGFDWWKDVAHKACTGLKHMKTESFAMLLPCGTDVFTGVEYVCCPNGATANATTPSPSKMETPSISVKIVPAAKVATDEEDMASVNKYMHMKETEYKGSEHDFFTHAKKQLTKVNHDKIAKLMKDWAEARKRVLELKKIDPKGAEKLNKEITPRYQKEYFALLTSSDTKTLQLDSVHQQHVQSNLDAKKRKAIEMLMQELQATKPSEAKLVKYLKRYINTEEKDAHHCIRHYTKIRDRDASQGQQLLPATISHLTLISKRINQSIDLLDSLKSEGMKTKITKIINDWRSKSFNRIENYVATFKKALASLPVVKAAKATTAKPVKEAVKDLVKEKTKVVAKVPVVTVVKAKQEKPAKGMYKQYAEKFALKAGLAMPPPVPDMKIDVESLPEHEHAAKPSPMLNHMVAGVGLGFESNAAVAVGGSQSVTANMSVGAGIAIAVGVVAGLLLVVFAVVMKVKSSSGKPARNTYAEVAVDENMSAEDRHIASMQNGYENPTYKLLEMRTTKA